jgi:hypothetical protein
MTRYFHTDFVSYKFITYYLETSKCCPVCNCWLIRTVSCIIYWYVMVYVSTKFYVASTIILKVKYIFHAAVMMFYIHEVKNHGLIYLMKTFSHASFLGPMLSVRSLASTSQNLAYSMLLLTTAGNSKAQYCDGLYLHNIRIRVHGNRLPDSKI